MLVGLYLQEEGWTIDAWSGCWVEPGEGPKRSRSFTISGAFRRQVFLEQEAYRERVTAGRLH